MWHYSRCRELGMLLALAWFPQLATWLPTVL